VFFFTAGIAFLTLIINATTCPTLVNMLGIAKSPESKNKVLLDVVRRLEEKREDSGRHEQCAVAEVLDYVVHHLDIEEHQKHAGSVLRTISNNSSNDNNANDDNEDNDNFMKRRGSICSIASVDSMGSLPSGEILELENGVYMRSGMEIIMDYKMTKKTFMSVPEVNKEVLGWENNWPTAIQEKALFALAQATDPNPAMVRAITESFLSLVRGDIWKQIQRGAFVDGSKSIEALLTTNSKASHMAAQGLIDFEYLSEYLGISETASQPTNMSSGSASEEGRTSIHCSNLSVKVDFDEEDTSFRNTMRKYVQSATFQGIILLVICANAIVIFMDPGPDSEEAFKFLIIDCCFLLVYLFELVAKLIVLRSGYFMNGWNALDFVCVVLGFFGVFTTLLVQLDMISASAISSEMLLIRLGRVFKMIRLLRVVIILKFLRKLSARMRGEKITPELALHLELMFTLRGFIQAHLQSQAKFLKYFGAQLQRCQCGNKLMKDSDFCRKCGTKRPDDMPKDLFYSLTGPEQARCILESWTSIFHATVVASSQCDRVDEFGHWILEGLESLRETTEVTETLTDFVMQAAEDGVILPKDAERIIHPMHDHLKLTGRIVRDTHAGIHRNVLVKTTSGHRLTAIENDPNSPKLLKNQWDQNGKDNPVGSGRRRSAAVQSLTSFVESTSVRHPLSPISISEGTDEVWSNDQKSGEDREAESRHDEREGTILRQVSKLSPKSLRSEEIWSKSPKSVQNDEIWSNDQISSGEKETESPRSIGNDEVWSSEQTSCEEKETESHHSEKEKETLRQVSKTSEDVDREADEGVAVGEVKADQVDIEGDEAIAAVLEFLESDQVNIEAEEASGPMTRTGNDDSNKFNSDELSDDVMVFL
jgi:hypothetical protein